MSEPQKSLTRNEELVLFGLVKYPDKNDKELASVLQMKDSTLTSIKKRLEHQEFFTPLYVPMLNRLGSELLGIIFTSFNPVIPLDERIKITKEKIEISDEIFLSVGAPEMGFSLSLNSDYTSFSRINETRTHTFGRRGLLDKEFPNEVIFPFDISGFPCFFEYSRLLESKFKESLMGIPLEPIPEKRWFGPRENVELSPKEKRVFAKLIEKPSATMQEIGDDVNLSRHTVARMKAKFFEDDLIRKIIIPDLQKIGFKLLVFYHFKFNPKHMVNQRMLDSLDSPATIFFAYRQFKTIIISAYPDYADYKDDKMNKLTFLKETGYITYTPSPRKYVFDQMEIIKKFVFAPITRRLLKIENE